MSRGEQPRQRTQQERERDRSERERRREGAATPDPQPPAQSQEPPHKNEELTSLAELQAELRATVPQAPPPPRRRPRISRVAGLVALVALGLAGVLLAASQLHGKRTPKVVVPKEVRVLVPEGETGAQIAEIAKHVGLRGSYADATKTSRLLDPAHYGAPKGTRSLEGFLFPATYDMDEGEPAANLVGKQLIAFGENFGSEEAHRAHELHITPYDLLIVASMIEREAQTPGDRPRIAAVIYNRLRAGIPLGIDATIYYAVEQAKGVATYTHELTESQLHIDSPYNTRLHKGLPPTPISNPGTASIHAAAHPAHVGYLYYVAGADGCGEQVFSDTETEFEADVSAYREAVAHNGGRPPTCKHKG